MFSDHVSMNSVVEKHSFQQSAFLSTPKFIEDLTKICEMVLECQDDREEFLKEKLQEINKSLPATVYVPTISDANRH